MPIKSIFDVTHICVESFKDDISNNLIESFNKQFKAWYKTKQGFNSFDSANNLISMFVFLISLDLILIFQDLHLLKWYTLYTYWAQASTRLHGFGAGSSKVLLLSLEVRFIFILTLQCLKEFLIFPQMLYPAPKYASCCPLVYHHSCVFSLQWLFEIGEKECCYHRKPYHFD